uniref:Uncharacterized protein n=1 Tax=viral metagenome TaxID=1070528 RepID=A0A6M3IPC6_9ZZZZ
MSRNKPFGVVVIPLLPDERYTDSQWETIDEAEDRRRFLQAHLYSAKVKICDWSSLYKNGDGGE